jgi:hypothetical protein
MHQHEPFAPTLPQSNAVPQRSQTRRRRGKLCAAGAVMVLPSEGRGILPCRGDSFKNGGYRSKLRQGSGPQQIVAVSPRPRGTIFHSLKAWPQGMAQSRSMPMIKARPSF